MGSFVSGVLFISLGRNGHDSRLDAGLLLDHAGGILLGARWRVSIELVPNVLSECDRGGPGEEIRTYSLDSSIDGSLVGIGRNA